MVLLTKERKETIETIKKALNNNITVTVNMPEEGDKVYITPRENWCYKNKYFEVQSTYLKPENFNFEEEVIEFLEKYEENKKEIIKKRKECYKYYEKTIKGHERKELERKEFNNKYYHFCKWYKEVYGYYPTHLGNRDFL